MRHFWIVILLGFIFTASAAAQDTCPTDLKDTLAKAAENCADIGTNEICYGHGAIDAVVNCEDAEDFDSPGDSLPSEVVCALRVDTWGVAIATLQVNEAAETIYFMLLGDVEITNAGSAFNALDIWANTDITIRSGPGSDFSPVGELAEGTEIVANGCNCTGNWLRVVMADGSLGWVPSGRVTIIGDSDALPVVAQDTPLYESLQAFTLTTGQSDCETALPEGVLLQVPESLAGTPLEINGLTIELASTVFLQSQPGGTMTIAVLEGSGRVTTSDYDVIIPAGTRATISITEENTPQGVPRIAPYTASDVANLPISLLPQPISPADVFASDVPVLVGAESCRVISDAGQADCPLYFINPDGDAITDMRVTFVSAPHGEWESTTYKTPEQLTGNAISGALAWQPTCSLGSENFIGPVAWEVTVTDEAGHVSEAFQVSFSCVDG